MAGKLDYDISRDKIVEQQYPTIVQIKSAIPGRFFEANLLCSFYYIVKDAAIIFGLYSAMQLIETYMPAWLLYLLLPAYWYFQGTMFMAVFVLGHDCGHGSFSKYEVINDLTGNVLHSLVLAPYYPWKLSHRNHHKHTGNIDKDEVFYPIRNKDHNGNRFIFLFGLGIGWFIYLLRGYHGRKICHLNPFEAMFSNHLTECVVSLFALGGWGYCLYYYAWIHGLAKLTVYYIIPELVFASWLLIVTFLHHIEEETPWYSGKFGLYSKIYFVDNYIFSEFLTPRPRVCFEFDEMSKTSVIQ